MKRRLPLATLLFLSFLFPGPELEAAGKREVHNATPEQLSHRLPGRRVSLVLKDSSELQAQVERVQRGLLEVVVRKTKNRSRFMPKSRAVVPIVEVDAIRYTERRGNLETILPAAAGGVGTTAGLSRLLFADRPNGAGSIAATVGAVVAGMAGAAFLGKHLDEVVVELRIVTPAP